jgi:hypothetical protein
MSIVWSCGGGTQSAAIAALIVQGKLPKPDLSVIADTGREASETWEFYEEIMRPELWAIGVDISRLPHLFDGERIAGENRYNTVDIYSGKDKNTIIMPMFTSQKSRGMLPKFCSNEWKSRPVQRFIREHGLASGEIWIGFSIDEFDRMRAHDPTKKWNHTYPLIDMRLSRGDCIAICEDMGWGTPPRSACWMCPYRNDQEWLHLKTRGDGDFQRAVDLEKKLQERDPDVYFHDTCQPLDEVGFNEEQEDMFSKPCASGMCFT